jgi:uncharacterized protein
MDKGTQIRRKKMSSPVVHFEILGKDASKLQDYYRNLFDWKINNDPKLNYGLVEAAAAESIGGGIGGAQPGAPGHVTIYIRVNDLQTYLKRAEQLGGKTVVPPTEVPGIVTFALFQDPEGNMIGMIQG